VLGITGIWSTDLIQVKLIIKGTILAILVPWQENPYTVIARPDDEVEIRASSLDNSDARIFFFAFTGITVEREGENIAPAVFWARGGTIVE